MTSGTNDLAGIRRRVTGGVAIFIAVMHSATPQRRKTAIEKGILGGKRKKSRVLSTAEPGGEALRSNFWAG